MATKCREKIKTKLVKYEFYFIFVGLLFVGLVIGLFIGSTHAKHDVLVKTVDVPTYEADKLPEVSDVHYFDVPLSHSLQRYLYEVCADNDVPVTLALAIIEQESQFNPEIVSDTDDYGLMQINEINHAKLEEQYRTADMLDPYQNVYCGVKIIGQYLKDYDGDMNKALMAYNMGKYGAERAWENGIKSTDYSEKVINLWRDYEKEFENGRRDGTN